MSRLNKNQYDENGKWIPPYANAPKVKGGTATAVVKKFEAQGQKWQEITDKRDFLDVMTLIEATRTAKSHALNDRSSRSHCIVILK